MGVDQDNQSTTTHANPFAGDDDDTSMEPHPVPILVQQVPIQQQVSNPFVVSNEPLQQGGIPFFGYNPYVTTTSAYGQQVPIQAPPPTTTYVPYVPTTSNHPTILMQPAAPPPPTSAFVGAPPRDYVMSPVVQPHDTEQQLPQQEPQPSANVTVLVGDERGAVEYYVAKEQVSKWGLQVKIWSIVLVVCAVFVLATSFADVDPVTGKVVTGISFTQLMQGFMYMFVGALGIVAGFKGHIRAARAYQIGLLAVVGFSIGLVVVGGLLGSLEAMAASGAAVIVTLMMVIGCSLGFGVICNLPCLACVFCAGNYHKALERLAEMEQGQGLNGTTTIQSIQPAAHRLDDEEETV